MQYYILGKKTCQNLNKKENNEYSAPVVKTEEEANKETEILHQSVEITVPTDNRNELIEKTLNVQEVNRKKQVKDKTISSHKSTNHDSSVGLSKNQNQGSNSRVSSSFKDKRSIKISRKGQRKRMNKSIKEEKMDNLENTNKEDSLNHTQNGPDPLLNSMNEEEPVKTTEFRERAPRSKLKNLYLAYGKKNYDEAKKNTLKKSRSTY